MRCLPFFYFVSKKKNKIFLNFFKMSTETCTDNSTACTTSDSTERMTGRCLSFHSRKGYGKILGQDDQVYFVHHSFLRPCYKPIRKQWRSTLYTGEYLSFLPETTDRGLVAKCVTGINDGPLMCDHAAWKIITYRQRDQQQESNSDSHPVQRRILKRPQQETDTTEVHETVYSEDTLDWNPQTPTSTSTP